MNDHGVIGVDAEHADLEQVAAASRADAHREIVIESPLRDGDADGVQHVLVSDSVLPGRIRDPRTDKMSCHASIVKACHAPA